MMYLGNQGARTVNLGLTSNGIPVPDGYYSDNVEVYSQCFDAGDNMVGIASLTVAGQSNGSCSEWTIVPNPDAANAGVADLYHHANNGSLILDGVYRDSHSVTVAR